MAGPASAQKDAAEKVQEGNVNNWIEYYKRQQEAKTPPAAEENGKAKDQGTIESEQERKGEASRKAPGEKPR